MKKTYINPAMEIVEIHTPQILAGSPDLGGNYNGTDPILSRDLDLELDDDPNNLINQLLGM